MASFDADGVTAPVSDDQPSGPDLEFDGDFGALERAAQGKAEQQFGTTIIPAEDPEWKEVVTQATSLLQRTRDLRVLSHLAVARLYIDGLPQFSEVVAAIHTLLDAQWDTVHPQLDPEEDNDPTLRANALLRLADSAWVMRRLRNLPLAGSARTGHISWRDIAIATGAIEVGDDVAKPSESQIRAAFQDSPPGKAPAMRAAAQQAADAATGIGNVFDSRAGYGSGPDLSELVKLLNDMVRLIDRFAAAGDDADAGADAAEEVADAGADDAHDADAAPAGAGPSAGPARRGVSAAALTEVATRGDALRLLDLVCRYYERYEPSSPLPMLIKRARGLAEKDFIEILRDLAPDGLSQAQVIMGNRDE